MTTNGDGARAGQQRSLVDHADRQKITDLLDTTLVVEAAAGTGKTTALVNRILALVASGRARLSGIAAVTFTDKAAGEMKLRLREAIEKARAEIDPEGEEKRHLDRALGELETARVATIHALCNEFLHERPIEACVDPLFGVLPEGEAQALFEQAFDGWFQEVLEDPPEGVRRFLRRRKKGGKRARDLLRDAAWRLANLRDFGRGWRRDGFDREAAIDQLVLELGEVGRYAEEATNPECRLVKSVTAIQHWYEELMHRESVRERDYDGLEAELIALQRPYPRHWTHKGYGRSFGDTRLLDVRAARDAVKARLDAVVDQCAEDLAPCLEEALWPVVDRYEAAKSQAGKLDFFDLLHKTRDLLVSDAGVRNDLQRRVTHVLVDEFQDTDPLQADILLLLAADDPSCCDPAASRPLAGKLFIVGDPKQSIYRFRRADVTLYERLKERLVADGAELVHLETSFRSDPRILEAVNVAFAPRMQGDGQARYVPLSGAREPDASRPAVVALPVPQPYAQWGKLADWETKKSFPEAVAAFVKWVVEESGWSVSDPSTKEMVPVQARHVCLLFRRMQSWGEPVADAYTRALEGHGVPHVLVGGRSYHDREEVVAVRSAVTAIEWPDDELSVFATLRGPLFAVGDDALLAWRHRFGALHPLRPRDEDQPLAPILEEVATPLDLLARLHRDRNRRPFADTVTQLLEATRAHAGLAFWSGGEQVLGNVLRMVELARRSETSGATSFRAFVESLQQDAERGEGAEAAVVEEGTEGVRIMTVHRAKGLEFPVVVLADPTCSMGSPRPSRFTDVDANRCFEALSGCIPVELREHAEEVMRRDLEESDRVLYVAATRARDVLVVPGLGDGPQPAEGHEAWWTSPLDAAIYPPDSTRHHSEVARGCPPFGQDTTCGRPARAELTRAPVKPGFHTTAGGNGVVWWDPHLVNVQVPETSGLRYAQILAPDPGEQAARASVERHARWAAERLRALRAGATPSAIVTTPTDLAQQARTSAFPVSIEETDAVRSGRPAGRRFGTLVHESLEALALDASEETLSQIVSWRGRVLAAPEEEVAAAVMSVRAALRHPRLAAGARSPDLRREVPLSYRQDDGTIVEGTADLAYRDPDDPNRWIVIDFKTSATEVDAREKWEAQVACYADAIHRATGDAASGVVLMV